MWDSYFESNLVEKVSSYLFQLSLPKTKPSAETPLTEEQIFAGFPLLVRLAIQQWRNTIPVNNGDETTLFAIEHLNSQLAQGDAIVFFDHHYAFDPVPAGIYLSHLLTNLRHVMVPYAIFLEMGVDPTGEQSNKFWIRSKAFQYFVHGVTRHNPSIKFYPLTRTFERETPTLWKLINERDDINGTANIEYMKTFSTMFREEQPGNVTFMAPMAGIAFPDKPMLHPELFRLLQRVLKKRKTDLPFYLVGAYPTFDAYLNYAAPLLTPHHFAARGPFNLSAADYVESQHMLEQEVRLLRRKVGFEQPDYELLKQK